MMMRTLGVGILLATFMVVIGGPVRAAEETAQKLVQVRVGNLTAVEDVAGTVTFELTDRGGITQSVAKEFHIRAGERLEDLDASFTYSGPFHWTIHIADDDGRQLTFLAGEYPGYPYSEAAPLSNRLRVVKKEQSVVFLDMVSFMLEFEAVALLREQTELDRVHVSAGLDSNGDGVFGTGEVVETIATPRARLVRVTVPALSSTVTTPSFFFRLDSPNGLQLAYAKGAWSYEGGDSVAFDIEAPEIRHVSALYGKPQPSRSVSTIAMPNPWHQQQVSLISANEGADFAFLLGENLHLILDEIGRSGHAPQTTQALITVIDEGGTPVEGATLEVDGHVYLTDEFGQATISASAAPGFHEMKVASEGLEPRAVTLDLAPAPGQNFSSHQIVLSRPGPGPLDRIQQLLADYWLTLLLGLGAVVFLALLVAAILIPSGSSRRRIGSLP